MATIRPRFATGFGPKICARTGICRRRDDLITTERQMRVLVVNAGSSSVKLVLLGDDDQKLAEREFATPQAGLGVDQLQGALQGALGDADAVGHRIVHGGELFSRPVILDRGVEDQIRALGELAPLHQPKSIAALDAVSAARPGLPSVACFDTAFHASLPPAARTYALPAAWNARWKLRRYGFHGLSHAWVARRAPELLETSDDLRIVSCHLGAGASLCAIAGGRSLDTTMGFTPLEGLVMATRSGSIDPGLVLWLVERTGISEAEVARSLEHESGLLGLAGSADMREVLARAATGDETAGLALDVYLHRLRAGICAMAASLGGLDALAFTGGVGENAPEIRRRALEGLDFLGLALDGGANRTATGDADLSLGGASAKTLLVEAREDLEIARQVREVLDA
jgi:acetate kinase